MIDVISEMRCDPGLNSAIVAIACFYRISERRRTGRVNCDAESRTNRHAQLQRDALSDRLDLGMHPLGAAYPLSYRQLEEMMEGRGVAVDHSSINRWAIRFLSLIAKLARKHKYPVGGGSRMDETYIKVKGAWKYLYRGVDKQGKTVDFLLAAKRDMAAAKRFFDKAMGANGELDKVAMHKSGANKAVIDAVNAGRALPILVRQVKYPNNIVEQDHRAINRITRRDARFQIIPGCEPYSRRHQADPHDPQRSVRDRWREFNVFRRPISTLA
jgi:putative transposase